MEKPNWIEKYRKKGTQIVRQKDNYYLYRVERVYDEKTKRSKKKTVEYLGKLTEKELIPPKHKRVVKPADLDPSNKLLRAVQVLCDIKSNKTPTTVAKMHSITVKTVNNIKKRFDEKGINGLIHTRSSKYETVKVSSLEQALIVTDYVKNPSKSAVEIKKSNNIKSTVSDIKKMILPISAALKLKKKILFEIE